MPCGGGLAQRRKLYQLSEAQNWRCCYCAVVVELDNGRCAKHGASIEHVVRRCDGGSRSWDNEVMACRDCNARRGDMDAFDYAEIMATHRHAPRKLRQLGVKLVAKTLTRGEVSTILAVERAKRKTEFTSRGNVRTDPMGASLADVWPDTRKRP